MALLSSLMRAGIKVPEEVSLIGCDALPRGKLVYPPLTIVDHAAGQPLSAAIDLLLQPEPPSLAVITRPTLVRRESTVLPPG